MLEKPCTASISSSSCPLRSAVAHPQYDPLRLSSRQAPSQKLSDGARLSGHRNSALRPSRRRTCFEVGSSAAFHLRACSVRMPNHRSDHRFCGDVADIGVFLYGKRGREFRQLGRNHRELRQLGRNHRRLVHTQAFNPGNGGPGSGGGGPGRAILNLAGAGLLTYLTITGRLNWLFDTILAIWLFSSLVWWFIERSVVKGPCPNCGGEFQVFEFALKDEYRLCPYCSQPFKLENRRFVRDEPWFSNQQGERGFKSPFGGFGGFEDFGRQSSSRKREDGSGVIVDIEAEVRDKD